MPTVMRKCALSECSIEFEVDQSVIDSGGGRYHSVECQRRGLFADGKDQFGMDLNAPSGRVNAVLLERLGEPLSIAEIAAELSRQLGKDHVSDERIRHHLTVWMQRPDTKLGEVLRQVDDKWYIDLRNK